MTDLLTMGLQMAGCIVVAVPVCAGFVWFIFTAADWLEGRR
jgi:hypothetical protein